MKKPGLLLLALVGMLALQGTAQATFNTTCQDVSFTVGLYDNAPKDQTIVGELCVRGSLQHRTIQVLLHGATYDHNYWAFPLKSGRYSYVEDALDAGFATLNIDRLGSGGSSHPNPFQLDLHTGATSIHQVVQALRSGTLTVPQFGTVKAERVMLVGHSLGSFISSIEASTYHDVDGVILSAYTHTPGPGSVAIQSDLYPAMFDAKFAASGLDPNYFTTVPGTRASAFYYTPNADATVIAQDDTLKQTVALGEVLDIPNSFTASSGITAPTLIVDGDYDTIDCLAPSCSSSGSLATEVSNFGAQACVRIVNIPNAGHDLNLHKNAPLFFLAANLWATVHVGQDSRLPVFPCGLQ